MTKSAPQPADDQLAEGFVTVTLVRGRYFSLRDLEWSAEKGVLSQRVDPATAEYLRRTAVDIVGTIDDEGEPLPITKPKFSFADGTV